MDGASDDYEGGDDQGYQTPLTGAVLPLTP